MTRDLHDKYSGPVSFSDDVDLYGQVAGDVTVTAGATLNCYGQIIGNLFVEKDGRATVYGMVIQSIVNRGGLVELRGVAGSVIDEGKTKTTVDAKALLTGLKTVS